MFQTFISRHNSNFFSDKLVLTSVTPASSAPVLRSEERFSRNAETDLVCRLLLEKKNMLRHLLTLFITTKPQRHEDKSAFHLRVFVALWLVLLAIFIGQPILARAERIDNSDQQRNAIPSPRSILGFTPGDDRTIADWKQITNYFAQLDQA